MKRSRTSQARKPSPTVRWRRRVSTILSGIKLDWRRIRRSAKTTATAGAFSRHTLPHLSQYRQTQAGSNREIQPCHFLECRAQGRIAARLQRYDEWQRGLVEARLLQQRVDI